MNVHIQSPTLPTNAFPGFRELIRSGLMNLSSRLRRQRHRRRLLSLEDRLLEDIGLTRAQALEEGSKPFWRD